MSKIVYIPRGKDHSSLVLIAALGAARLGHLTKPSAVMIHFPARYVIYYYRLVIFPSNGLTDLFVEIIYQIMIKINII